MSNNNNSTVKTYDLGAADYHARRQQSWVGRGNLDEYINQAHCILDFGCGPGILIPELIRLNFKGDYVGYDPSKGMIEEAVKSYQSPCLAGRPAVSSIQSQELNFQKEFSNDLTSALSGRIFDTVFSIAVLHHLSASEIRDFLKRISTALEENARIIFTLWEIDKSKRHKKFRIGNTNKYLVPLRDNQGTKTGERLYYDHDVDDLKDLFEICGFKFIMQKEIKGEGFSNKLLEFKFER